MSTVPSSQLSRGIVEFRDRFASDGSAARKYLEDLRQSHPSQWAIHPLPEWAVAPAWRLEALLQMGLGRQAESRLDHLEALRLAALRANAPLKVHHLLKAQGLGPMSKQMAGQQGASAIDHGRLHSLKAIHADHPQVIERSVSVSPAIGLLKAVGRFLNRPSKGSVDLLELLDGWGADWEHASLETLLASQPLEKQRLWEVRRHLLLEGRMDKVLAPAVQEGDLPSRMRPRRL